MRRLSLAVLAAALAAVPAAEAAVTASGNVVATGGGKYDPSERYGLVAITGDPAAPADVTFEVVPLGDAVLVRDPGGVTAALGCSPLDATTASCPLPLSPTRPASVTVTLGDGADRLDAFSSLPLRVKVTAGAGDDVVDLSGLTGVRTDLVPEGWGGPGRDGGRIAGGPGADALTGGARNEALDGGPGDDTLRGGGGADLAAYAGATEPVRASLMEGRAEDGQGGVDVLAEVEGLLGGAADDVLTGDDEAGALLGGPGADVLDGRGGADVLMDERKGFERGAAHHDDVLLGGDGDDALLTARGRDRLEAGAGDDFVSSAAWGRAPRPPSIACGAGFDAIETLRRPRLDADCERYAVGRVSPSPARVTRLSRWTFEVGGLCWAADIDPRCGVVLTLRADDAGRPGALLARVRVRSGANHVRRRAVTVPPRLRDAAGDWVHAELEYRYIGRFHTRAIFSR